MDHQFKKYRLIHGIFFAGGIVLTFVCEGRGQTSKLEEHVNALYPPGTEQAKTEALSRYAWGFYLSLNEDSDAEIVADQYLAAVANDPKSEFFVKELVEHWTVHNPAEQHERVIEYLADIACRDAAAVGLNTVVANAYMYEERYEDARQLLITVFDEVRWRHPHVIKQLVICHLKIGDINKAHRLVRRATKKKRLGGNFTMEQTAAAFYDAVSQSSRHRLSRSRREEFNRLAYGHALEALDAVDQPKSYDGVMTLANMFVRVDSHDEAARLLEVLHLHAQATEMSERTLADCYERLDRPVAALTVLQRLAELYGFNHNYHIRTARLLQGVNRHEDAAHAFENAYKLTLNPYLAYETASSYLLAGRAERTLIYASHAPDDVPATHLLRCQAYRQLGRNVEALAALKELEKIATQDERIGFPNVDYLLLLAQIFHDINDKSATIKALESALKLQPDNHQANNFIGYYLAQFNEQLDRAETMINRALESVPDSPAYMDSLAWVYYRQGKLQQAAAVILEAVSLQGGQKDGVILEHAGDIFFALDEFRKATFYWEEALKCQVDRPDEVQRKIDEHRPAVK